MKSKSSLQARIRRVSKRMLKIEVLLLEKVEWKFLTNRISKKTFDKIQEELFDELYELRDELNVLQRQMLHFD